MISTQSTPSTTNNISGRTTSSNKNISIFHITFLVTFSAQNNPLKELPFQISTSFNGCVSEEYVRLDQLISWFGLVMAWHRSDSIKMSSFYFSFCSASELHCPWQGRLQASVRYVWCLHSNPPLSALPGQRQVSLPAGPQSLHASPKSLSWHKDSYELFHAVAVT